jgi:hypothetical protein
MQQTITCVCCGKTVPANPLLKGEQKYCNDNGCQNERKRIWYQHKLATDPQYANRQKRCKRRWRQQKPARWYQNHYRQTHHDYSQKNRDQQRERNRRRQKQPANLDAPAKIVKIDALAISEEQSTIYEMKILTRDASKRIVKIDPLLVQLSLYQKLKPEITADCKD